MHPREIESETWALYPVDEGRAWALCHRSTGGLVEGLTSADLRDLAGLLAEARRLPVSGAGAVGDADG